MSSASENRITKNLSPLVKKSLKERGIVLDKPSVSLRKNRSDYINIHARSEVNQK